MDGDAGGKASGQPVPGPRPGQLNRRRTLDAGVPRITKNTMTSAVPRLPRAEISAQDAMAKAKETGVPRPMSCCRTSASPRASVLTFRTDSVP